MLNAYNPGLPPMQAIDKEAVVDLDLMTGRVDQFEAPVFGLISRAAQQLKKGEAGGFQTGYVPNIPTNNLTSPRLERNQTDLMHLRENQIVRLPIRCSPIKRT